MNAQDNPFIEFIKRYRDNPVLFAQEVMNMTPDPWQKDVLVSLALNERRIAVRSGHGVGKSRTAATAMLWFFITRFPVKVVVTAPTSAQLYDALFAEVKARIQDLPDPVRQLLEVKAERIELKAAPNDAFISARTSRAENPEALQGVHSENVLLVGDEASGIPEAVFEAAGGSMSGHKATTLLLGNPTRSSGYFFECFHKDRENWKNYHVSSLTSSRVSHDYIKSMKDKYGEESNAYRVRVLGDFPKTDDDTMIGYELVQTAMDRDIQVSYTTRGVWGVDVARFGSDRSALAKRYGGVVSELRSWRDLDLMQLTGAIKSEWDATPEATRPSDIFVDVIGLGAGVVDRLRELKLPAIGINVSEAPALGGSYANLRAELWGKTKSWLEQRGCQLPKNDELLAELTSPRYTFMSSGKLLLESKDAMRKRGLPSPDLADALVLTMAADAVIGIYGESSASDWNQPLRRNLRGVA